MFGDQGSAEVDQVVAVAIRVARARQRGAVANRRNEELARIGSVEATEQWRAPRGWLRALETDGATQKTSLERQTSLRAGGEEEAAVRASAGAAMLAASRSFAELPLRDDEVGYSLENAVVNLLHIADEVGVDPLRVLAGALERYEDTLGDEEEFEV